MDLTLSDEQLMLRESAQRFVRDWSASPTHDASLLWRQFADLGWLAMPLPEDHGGLNGSTVDLAVLIEEFGRGLLATPYVSTIILGGGLLVALGTDAQKAAILPQIAAGHLKLAFAHAEPGPRGGVSVLKTQAFRSDEGWRLAGTKVAVLDGMDADTLIVSARLEGRTALFIAPRETLGLSLVGYTALSGGHGATITLDDVLLPANACLTGGDATEAIEAAVDAAITALSAEAIGMMAAMLDATVAYTNTREQFSKPLTGNQSVRFKLADMAVALEEARSIALRAALTLAAPATERIRAVAGAKAKVGRDARRLAELAIQLHGAMGVTEELKIGAYYKRILAFEAMFGGMEHQLVRHARASGRMTSNRSAA